MQGIHDNNRKRKSKRLAAVLLMATHTWSGLGGTGLGGMDLRFSFDGSERALCVRNNGYSQVSPIL
jgi:hypothetical protein